MEAEASIYYPPAVVRWLDDHALRADHLDALCNANRVFAQYAQRHLTDKGMAGDYSYLAAAISTDLEAELSLAASGFPLQALALLRGTWEKLAFWRAFLLELRDHRTEFLRPKALFGKGLLEGALQEHFDQELLSSLNRFTHADLRVLRELHLLKEEIDDPEPTRTRDLQRFTVGAHFGWQFRETMRKFSYTSATWALQGIQLMKPPREYVRPTLVLILELVERLHHKHPCMSERTLADAAQLRTHYELDSGE